MVLAPQRHSKLEASYQGLYQILEKVTPVTYLIDVPGRKGKGQQLHVMLKKWKTPSASVMAIAVVAEPSEMSDAEGEIITWEVNGPNQPTLSDDLTSKQKQQMKEILNKREKTFHTVPGKTNLVEHSIRLSQTVPVRRPMYRVLAAFQDPVCEELDAQARNYRAINQSLVTLTCACQQVKDHTNGDTSVRRLSTHQCGYSPRPLLDATDQGTSGEDRECEVYLCL